MVTLEDRFARRLDDISTYEVTWWTARPGPWNDRIAADPDLANRLTARLANGQPTTTRDVYCNDDVYDPARVATHEEILGALDDVDDALHSAAAGAASRPEAAYFLLGLPASGKSSALRVIAARHAAGLPVFDGPGGAVPAPRLAVSDADEVRVLYPEYAEGDGGGILQAENVDVTYGDLHLSGRGRQDRVLARTGAVMVDVIGDADYLVPTITKLADSGVACYVLRTQLDVAECQRRAMRRCVENGRHVPLQFIEDKRDYPALALDAAIATGRLAGWAVIDTASDPKLLSGDGTFL